MRGACAVGTAVAVALSALLAGCAGPSGATLSPASPPTHQPSATAPAGTQIAISVVPDRTTARAGDDIPATVEIRNLTGHEVAFTAGLCSGKVPIGVASDAIAFDPAIAAMGCNPWMLPVAGFTYRDVISTRYGECLPPDGWSLDKGAVHCNADGTMPALPAGRYRTAVATLTDDRGTVFLNPVTITLTR